MQVSKDSLVMLGVVLALVAVATLAVYMPQGRALNECKAQAATYRTSMENDSKLAAVVPDMVRQVQDMKSRYKNFDRRLPKQKELAGFLKEISGNLSQERLANQLIEPGSPSREEAFNTLPIIMKFQGSYLSLASFLKRIDKMERLTRVEKLNVSIDPKDPTVNIEMQLNIYFSEG